MCVVVTEEADAAAEEMEVVVEVAVVVYVRCFRRRKVSGVCVHVRGESGVEYRNRWVYLLLTRDRHGTKSYLLHARCCIGVLICS